jgi:hypothetical protein
MCQAGWVRHVCDLLLLVTYHKQAARARMSVGVLLLWLVLLLFSYLNWVLLKMRSKAVVCCR